MRSHHGGVNAREDKKDGENDVKRRRRPFLQWYEGLFINDVTQVGEIGCHFCDARVVCKTPITH